jgi:hypothetical protein
MKKILINLIFLTTISIANYGQDTIVLKKAILGTFHTENKIFNGLSFGFASTMADDRNVKTNGLRLEIPGIGFLSFMGNGFPNAKEPFDLTNHRFSEVINGLNISTGSWCDCNYNGLTIAAVGQYGKLGQGFSLAGGWNIIDKQNGLQIALIITLRRINKSTSTTLLIKADTSVLLSIRCSARPVFVGGLI